MKQKSYKILFVTLFAWIIALGIALFFSRYRPVLKGCPPGRENGAVYINHCFEFIQFAHTQLAHVNKQKLEETGLSISKQLRMNIFPAWYGTPWSFYGNTNTPGRGSIACGYFVTTVLRDIGVPLDRNKLAQLASEEMIKILVSAPQIKRYRNRTQSEFMEGIRKNGFGVYIIGLDNHTGFILNDSTGVDFIHSSGRFPWCVVCEPASSSVVLIKSKYKVTGKKTADLAFLERWAHFSSSRT